MNVYRKAAILVVVSFFCLYLFFFASSFAGSALAYASGALVP